MFFQAKEFNNGSIELDSTTGEYVASSNPGPELYFNTSNVVTMFNMFSNADLFNSPFIDGMYQMSLHFKICFKIVISLIKKLELGIQLYYLLVIAQQ